jgi:hypothetical protein
LVTTKRKKAYQKKRKRSKAALDISFHCKKAIQNAIVAYFSLTFSQISQFVGGSPTTSRLASGSPGRMRSPGER